ncbi:MAG: 30S ribosomal protein S6e [Thermoprotei archaeon]|nr:MAG: 30S ribosomal protein S6e [Thermoprotei archaeon]
MPTFKVVISDPMTGLSKQVEVKDPTAQAFIGRKIGDVLDGKILGLPEGIKIQITGGSGNEGSPLLPFIEGPVKRYALLSGPPGFHPRRRGERRRKLVRGNTITDTVSQINVKIIYPPNWDKGPIITWEVIGKQPKNKRIQKLYEKKIKEATKLASQTGK